MSLVLFQASVVDIVEVADADNCEKLESLLSSSHVKLDFHDPIIEKCIIRCIDRRAYRTCSCLLREGERCEDDSDPSLSSLLCDAVDKSSLAVIRALLDAGAHVDGGATNVGVWPLEKAAMDGREDLVVLLLERRASTRLSGQEDTPSGLLQWVRNHVLALACRGPIRRRSSMRAPERRARERIARLLIEHGAEVNAPIRGSDMYPLHFACRHGMASSVKLLLDCGARTASAGVDGQLLAVQQAVYSFTDQCSRLGPNCEELDAEFVETAKHYLQIIRMIRLADSDFIEQDLVLLATQLSQYPDMLELFFGCFQSDVTPKLCTTILSSQQRSQYEYGGDGRRSKSTALRSLRLLLSYGADANAHKFGLNGGLYGGSNNVLLDSIRASSWARTYCLLAWGADIRWAMVVSDRNHGMIDCVPIQGFSRMRVREIELYTKRQTSFVLALNVARRAYAVCRQFSLVDAYVIAQIVLDVWRLEHVFLREEPINDELLHRHERTRRRSDDMYAWFLWWEDMVKVVRWCIEQCRSEKLEEFLEYVRGAEGGERREFVPSQQDLPMPVSPPSPRYPTAYGGGSVKHHRSM